MGKTNPRQPAESTPPRALPSRGVPLGTSGVDPIEVLLLEGPVGAPLGCGEFDLDTRGLIDLHIDIGAILAGNHIAHRRWVIGDLPQEDRARSGHGGWLVGIGHEGAWTKPVHAGLEALGGGPVGDNLLLLPHRNDHRRADRLTGWRENLNREFFFTPELVIRGVDQLTIADLCGAVLGRSDIGNC